MYHIPIQNDSRAVIQNSCIENVWRGLEKRNIVALEAPTGFGKTFVSLALAKNWVNEKKQRVLIATAATNHTVNFWKDHLKQEKSSSSEVPLSFLVGKGNQSYQPCAHLEEWSNGKENENHQADSIYALCDLKKETGQCQHYLNLYQEQNGTATLTSQGKKALVQLGNFISDPQRENPEDDLVNTIQRLKAQHLCPYYLLKERFSQSPIQVCDYQYLINPRYLEENTENFLLIIDEFDKFEERLKEQFRIELSLAKLHAIELDAKPTHRLLFRQAFDGIEPEQHKVLLRAILHYVNGLKEFFSLVASNLNESVPRGIDLEKQFFASPYYQKQYQNFSAVFRENKEPFMKIIPNAALSKNPYRHLLAFHHRLERSMKQTDSLSFTEFVRNKRTENRLDTLLVRQPLVFSEFYQQLSKRYQKIVVMSATLPFTEMLEINFGQEVEWVKIPKAAGLIGKREGILLTSPFFDFSNKHRAAHVAVKTEMLSDLLEQLSKVRSELVVFFNSYSAFFANKEALFSKLDKKGFHLFIDQEKHKNRDDVWEAFKKNTGKKILFSTMYTKYARGSNMLKDDGCRIQVLVGIPFPQVYDFEIGRFNQLAKKQGWKINAETWYFVLSTRQLYTQVIGRLTRSTEDYGFFVVVANPAVQRILDLDHRERLGIQSETEFIQDCTDAAEAFFQTISKPVT